MGVVSKLCLDWFGCDLCGEMCVMFALLACCEVLMPVDTGKTHGGGNSEVHRNDINFAMLAIHTSPSSINIPPSTHIFIHSSSTHHPSLPTNATIHASPAWQTINKSQNIIRKTHHHHPRDAAIIQYSTSNPSSIIRNACMLPSPRKTSRLPHRSDSFCDGFKTRRAPIRNCLLRWRLSCSPSPLGCSPSSSSPHRNQSVSPPETSHYSSPSA